MPGRCADAQGPTTAAIAGRIIDERGQAVAGVDVVVTNRGTGFSMYGRSRDDGRYRVSGLDVGGPYSVTVRRIGSRPTTQTGFFVSLGETLQVDVSLEQQTITLQAMESQAARSADFSRTHQGTQSLLGDSLIHQMPVINRNLYDLVRLVPQMSTWYASTASGSNPRGNSIRIDGISDQVASSTLAAGALYGAKSIPLDAVKEYQVSFSPFDVRLGDFAGSSINVVTKGGTNEFHGDVFAYGTNEGLGANVPLVQNLRYDNEQYGLSLGGPVVQDRLLFFLASEVQQRTIPASGPYVGQGPMGESMLPVSTADISRFSKLLSADGLDGGTAGAVTNANPSSAAFLRLDAPLSRWNSRITARASYSHGDSSIFARPTALAPTNCPTNACFPLSSLQHSRWVDKRSAGFQFVSNLASDAYNELLVGYTGVVSGFRPAAKEPLVLVTVPGTDGSPAVLQSGTHEIATGQRNASWTTEFTDNLSFSAGAHRITAGLSAQLFDLRAFQERGAYGVWEFASLDSLQAGIASRYRVTRDTGSTTAAKGGYGAAYVSDEWDASPRLSLTLGLRSDLPLVSANLPYVNAVDSALHRRTDALPSRQAQWSPRLGFTYDLTTVGAPMQLRGGVGLFTGRPALFWLFGGFSAYGLAQRTLQCGFLSSDAGPAPSFNPDYGKPPLACAGGQSFGASTTGEIDVIDSHLRLPQSLRASLAVDRQLPLDLVGTIEALYTRATNAIFFSGINLAQPVATDHDGRVMYGTISASGVASPRRIASQLGDVVSVGGQSRDRAYDITGELRKTGRAADVSASLSYGRTRDVQSPRPVSALLVDDWRFARPVAGQKDDMTPGISDYDQPFRVRASGTLHSPWARFRTDLSFFYVGGSGLPYTYVAGGTQGRGDLNADGATGNDPIYIPRTAFDTSEIRFSGSPATVAAQQSAFENFIDGADCLRKQRGRIMARNSCRTPWMSLTNLALRQTLPTMGAQALALELQIFNFLNLLNPRWGREQLPTGATPTNTNQVTLLSQSGETPQAQPVYSFDPMMRRYSYDNFDTYYQIQLAVRYTF
jgi:hypothetical protein